MSAVLPIDNNIRDFSYYMKKCRLTSFCLELFCLNMKIRYAIFKYIFSEVLSSLKFENGHFVRSTDEIAGLLDEMLRFIPEKIEEYRDRYILDDDDERTVYIFKQRFIQLIIEHFGLQFAAHYNLKFN